MRNAPPSDDTYEKVMNRALGLLGARAYSVADLRAKLTKRCEQPGLVATVIDRLLELGYLNDVSFAANYAKARLRIKPLGRRQLAVDLKRRSVPSAIVEDTLQTLFEEEDEVAHCRRAIEKWVRIKGETSTPQERKRLFDHLARKGFDFRCIQSALEKKG